MDNSHIKFKLELQHSYCTLDKDGHTIGFVLSKQRYSKACMQLGKKVMKSGKLPEKIPMNKLAANEYWCTAVNMEAAATEISIKQIYYSNNIIQQNNQFLKTLAFDEDVLIICKKNMHIHCDFTTNILPTVKDLITLYYKEKSIHPYKNNVAQMITIVPSLIIDFLDHLVAPKNKLIDKKEHILFLMIQAGLNQISYGLDRKDKASELLLAKVQDALDKISDELSLPQHCELLKVIYETKLPLRVHISSAEIYTGKIGMDIHPSDITLLKMLTRDPWYKNIFILYEFFIVYYIQLQPENEQKLAMMLQLITSQNPVVYQLLVLALVHHEFEVRDIMAYLLNEFAKPEMFTAVDLRRLHLIRNWLPLKEAFRIDCLIKKSNQQDILPAPMRRIKEFRILSTIMDGSGALEIFILVKHKQQIKITSFIVKIGVGIKEAWIMPKSSDANLEKFMHSVHFSPSVPVVLVNKNYLAKLVQFGLSESIRHKNIPGAVLLEIAELIGIDIWKPKAFVWDTEFKNLCKFHKNKLTDLEIQQSLQCTNAWQMDAWFEVGEIVEQACKDAEKMHKTNPSTSLERITTRFLMNKCLAKWKSILLFNYWWMRYKRDYQNSKDLFIILYCLEQEKYDVADIPLLRAITAKSMAAVVSKQAFKLDHFKYENSCIVKPFRRL
jgi:hypothetical protein